MSAPASASTPVHTLKWRMGPKERGRKHMAMFVPCPLYKNADPSAKDCPGTLFQVKGSPLAGFMHEIRPDWTCQKDNSTDFVHFLCHWEAQQTPDPKPNGALDQIALTVRPPGVSQPLWDAESIFDCQDWVFDFVTRLMQKGMVDAAALGVLRSLQDEKTALMRQPGSGSTSTPLFTASMGRVVQSVGNEITQTSSPVPPGRRHTNSEWDTELKGFKRYDQTAR